VQRELLRYQSIPCRQTLSRLIIATEAIRRRVARQVATKAGRLQDELLIDDMVVESAFRICRMADRLRRLQVKSAAQLAAYIAKLAFGASVDAGDNPVFGATRRNLRRRLTVVKHALRIEWPDETAEQGTPAWSHASDRGDAYWCLVAYVEAAARRLARGLEVPAVEQVLKLRTDEATATRLGLTKSVWQKLRREAMESLAVKIAWSAPFAIDEIAKEILGKLWIEQAEKAERAVLYEEGLISDAA
jgi:hypothetical protein